MDNNIPAGGQTDNSKNNETIHVTNVDRSSDGALKTSVKDLAFNTKYRLKNLKVLGVLSLSFLLVSLGVGVVAVQRQQDIGEQALSFSATFELPSETVVSTGQTFNVPVMMISNNTPINQVYVAIRYDPTYLRLRSVEPRPLGSVLDKYSPVVNGEFDEKGVVVTANNSGVVRFNAESSNGSPFQGTRGADNPLAILTFDAIEDTQTPTKVHFITQEGASMAVSSSTGSDILTGTGEMRVFIQ